MRNYLRKSVLWLLCLAICAGTIFCPMVVIGESVSINSSQWEDLLHQYFSYINQGNYTAIVQMHHPDLQEDLNSTYMNIKNIQNHMGISNIQNAKVEDITMLNTQQIERIVSKMADAANLQQYEAYTAIIISVDLKVYTDELFLKNGINYLCPVWVKDGNQWWMYGLLVPTEQELSALQGNGIMPLGMDTPTEYDDYGNPSYILIKHTVVYEGEDYTLNEITEEDFRDYCHIVTSCEVGYSSWNIEALKANALAIKTFAIARVNYFLDAERGYHMTNSSSSGQCYNTAKAEVEKCIDAVDAIWHKIILDKNGCLFPTFYRRGSSTVTQYQNYGFLNQTGSNVLANNGYTYVQILNYYYNRVSNVTYYNTEVPVGAIQVVDNHVHRFYRWESVSPLNHQKSCTICSTTIYADHEYVDNGSTRKCSVCGYTLIK